MKRFIPAILMLANAIAAFFLAWSGEELDDTFIAGVLYAVTLGLLALLLAVRPRGFVVLLARGVGVAILVSVVGLGLISGAIFALGAGAGAVGTVAIGIALIVVQLRLLRAIPLEDANPARRFVKTALGTGFALFIAFALFYLAMIGETMAEMVMLVPRVRADSVMRASVPRVQACAAAFAKRHGGYPPSLAAMGPAPQGDGCLDARHASGRIGRITLSYAPAAPNTGGRISSYEVVARGNIGFERGEPWMAFGDETGIVRAGDSVATPGALRIIHGGMDDVRSIRACAELHRLRDSLGAYPRDWRTRQPIRESDSHEQNIRWLGCYRYQASFDPTIEMRSVGTYAPVGDSARPRDYVVEIRPRVYGVTGVRSVRMTARGRVHSTAEDRPATDEDAVVPECAYEVGDGTCAPATGGIPARVDVIIPDTVAAGESFSVNIVDLRPARERDHPYQYRVLCNYRRFGDPPEPPSSYEFSSSARCVADAERSEHGYVIVRVWVRDYATTESSIYRRAHLVQRER
jgi:hypothetical protein